MSVYIHFDNSYARLPGRFYARLDPTPVVFFFSSRGRHTRYWRDWSSDVCSSDLDVHAKPDQLVDQRMHAPRKIPGERARRAARRLHARRIDEVGDAFGLRQVETVVEEGALGEFAGLREPRAQLDASMKELLHHDRAAVALQLEHILPRIRVRGREEKRDTPVHDVALDGAKARQGRVAGCGLRSGDRLRDGGR